MCQNTLRKMFLLVGLREIFPNIRHFLHINRQRRRRLWCQRCCRRRCQRRRRQWYRIAADCPLSFRMYEIKISNYKPPTLNQSSNNPTYSIKVSSTSSIMYIPLTTSPVVYFLTFHKSLFTTHKYLPIHAHHRNFASWLLLPKESYLATNQYVTTS